MIRIVVEVLVVVRVVVVPLTDSVAKTLNLGFTVVVVVEVVV
jgi:hypothetical protein